MAIEFFCECGKQLRARAQFAGRRMKCPDCAKILTIPEPPKADAPIADAQIADSTMAEEAMVESPPADAPVQGGTSGEPDWFAAAVAEIAIADEAAGSDITVAEVTIVENVAEDVRPAIIPEIADDKEPSSFPDRVADRYDMDETLPLTAGLAPQPPPLARLVSQRGKQDPWTDRSLEQRATPWRDGDRERFQPGPEPRERSFGWIKVVVLLLIVGGVVFAAQRIPSLAERAAAWEARSDLDLVPSNAGVVIAVRLGDIWNGSKDSLLRAALTPGLAESIVDDLNIATVDIERATLVIAAPPMDQPAIKRFGGKGLFGGMPMKGVKGKFVPGQFATGKGMAGKGGMKSADSDIFDSIRSNRHLLIVRTHKPLDAQHLSSLVIGKYTFLHKDRAFHMLNNSRLLGACMLIVNSRTVMVGWKQDIEQALTDLDTPQSERLSAAVAHAGNKHVVVAQGLSRPLSQVLPKTVQTYYRRMVPGAAHGMLDVLRATLAMHESGQGFEAEARLTFMDKAAADRMAEAISPAALASEANEWERFGAAAPAHFRPLLQQVGSAFMSRMTIEPHETELTLTMQRKKGEP